MYLFLEWFFIIQQYYFQIIRKFKVKLLCVFCILFCILSNGMCNEKFYPNLLPFLQFFSVSLVLPRMERFFFSKIDICRFWFGAFDYYLLKIDSACPCLDWAFPYTLSTTLFPQPFTAARSCHVFLFSHYSLLVLLAFSFLRLLPPATTSLSAHSTRSHSTLL